MSPWILRAVAVAVISGSLAVASSVARQAPGLEKIVKIDGKTEPDRIPEWLAWQFGLRTLASVKKEHFREYFKLVLEPNEAELVEKEAFAQRERDEACWRAQEQRQEELSPRGATLQEIVNEQKTIVLGCRARTLEACDRLLAALSPDAQFALTNWMDEGRAHITYFVPVNDLEYFKQPR